MIKKNGFILSLLIFGIFCYNLSTLLGCQDYNSNSSDKLKYGGGFIDDGGDPNFTGAMQIIQAKCVNCHEGRHNAWVSYNNQQWIASGLIVQGQPDSSPLILSTTNVGGNMPKPPIADLTPQEYQFLRDWVTNIP